MYSYLSKLIYKVSSSLSIDNILLMFFLVLSWFLYPVMLKFMLPITFRIIIAVLFVVMIIVSFKYRTKNKLVYGKLEKTIFYSVGVYFFILLLSTLINFTFYNIYQYSIYLGKYFLFVFILLYADNKIIYKSFKYYSYLSLVVAVMAIFIGLGVTFNLFTYSELLTDLVDKGFKVYYGSYYSYSDINWFGNKIYRLAAIASKIAVVFHAITIFESSSRACPALCPVS